MDNRELLRDLQAFKTDIFLLTKPPKSDRTKICMQLMAKSRNAALYLAGDGVYNLLDDTLKTLPSERIFACKEDMEARGIQPVAMPTTPIDFYERLVEDIMLDENRIYTF